jgi:superfamily II DNA/RNA helicase
MNHKQIKIKTEYGYQQTLHWIATFEADVENLKREYLPHRPDLYRVFAGGTLSELEKLKKEIAEYEKTKGISK